MIVQLTAAEAYLAATAGMMRQFNASKKGLANRFGADDDWGLHIEGALAELVVAKHFNLYWAGGLRTNDDDVGGIQVRSTRYKTGRLRIHASDKDEAPYVLVIRSENWKFIIVGWLLGKEGKREEWWSDPTGKGRHAYFVPQGALQGIESLKLPRLNDVLRAVVNL